MSIDNNTIDFMGQLSIIGYKSFKGAEMRKFYGMLLVILSIMFFSCSITNVISSSVKNDSKLIIQSDSSCITCDSLSIINMSMSEENRVWSNLVSSESWKASEDLMKDKNYIHSMSLKRIMKVYCPIKNDTFYYINVPFKYKSNDSTYKAEIMVLIQKSNNKRMFVKLESHTAEIGRSISDSSDILVIKSETDLEYPSFSVFNTISDTFYISINALTVGDIYYPPSPTTTDRLYSCFVLCFDNCTAGLGEEDWEDRVSTCYDMCLIRCHFNWIP